MSDNTKEDIHMTLYDLAEEITAVANNLEAVYESDEEGRAELLEAWETTLDAVGGEFDEKAGNIAALIKNLKAEEAALKAEADALERRRKVKENAAKRLTEYLKDAMIAAGKKKLDTLRAALSIKDNPESTVIENETAFIAWAQGAHHDEYLTYSAPKINKTAVKAALKDGDEVPGASLLRGKRLEIK